MWLLVIKSNNSQEHKTRWRLAHNKVCSLLWDRCEMKFGFDLILEAFTVYAKKKYI